MKRLIGYTAALCLLAFTVGCGGVTSTGTLAYISNSTGTGFTVFTVNTDGTLTKSSISPQNTPASPKVLQFSANGKWAYFLDNGGSKIYAYTRAGNGTLATEIDAYPLTGGPNASSLVVAPNSTFLYVALPATKELSIFSIDQSTGILSSVGSPLQIGYAITQLVMAPGGNLLMGLAGVYPADASGVSQQTVVTWTLNSSSGVATQAATQPVGTAPSYLALSANGSYAYVLDAQAVTTVTVPANGATPAYTYSTPNIYGFSVGSNGVLTQMAGSPFNENPDSNGNYPTKPVAGATTNDNRYFFVANQGTHNISAFKISTTSGELSEVLGSVSIVNGISTSTASPFDCGVSDGCNTPAFVSVPAGNNAMYVLDTTANKIFQFRIDQNTGKLRQQSPAFVSAEGGPTWITIR